MDPTPTIIIIENSTAPDSVDGKLEMEPVVVLHEMTTPMSPPSSGSKLQQAIENDSELASLLPVSPSVDTNVANIHSQDIHYSTQGDVSIVNPIVVESKPAETNTSNFTTPTGPESRIRKHLEAFPETPKVSKPQAFRLKPRCPCVAVDMEESWNDSAAFTFSSQVRQNQFDSMKCPKLTQNEIFLSSEFLVGKGMSIKICLLKDESLSINERVLIVFNQGENEIRMCAHPYLKYGAITMNSLMFTNDELRNEGREEILCETHQVHGEFSSDSYGKWIVFRTYVQSYVADRINICSQTWVEILGLQTIFSKIAMYYTMFTMQGRAVTCKMTQPVEKKKKKNDDSSSSE